MTHAGGKSYRENVNDEAFSRDGQTRPALPLVRLTLALRDPAEFEAAHAARLDGEGLFVTTLRVRAAGERVRLRVELVSGATAWSGEAVVTGAGRERGRTGFWVRRAPAPSLTPPPLPRAVPARLSLRATPPPALSEPARDETSFEALWSDDVTPVAAPEAPAAAPAPAPARSGPPPLPGARRTPSRPDLSAIFHEAEPAEADEDALLEDPLQGGLPLPDPEPYAFEVPTAPMAVPRRDVPQPDEEWIEGGIASLELPPEDEVLEDLY
jgi:hypothetical protein